MRTKICAFMLLMALFAWLIVEADGDIQLIEEGSTYYRIMLGPGASPIDEFAAQELQGYVMQISNVVNVHLRK